MNRYRFLFLLLPVAVALAAGCGRGEPPGSAPENGAAGAASTAARAEARMTFDTLCASCHGNTGKGDGPAAAAMDPKPRSFGDKSWQTSVTDDHISKVITLGGAAVGKSPAMVAQPQLKGKPEVLRALIDIVRGFGK